MKNKDDLQKLIKDKLKDHLFIIASNRQPYVHNFHEGKIKSSRGVGGVVSALDPVMQACKGLWVAYGSGSADQEVTDNQGKVSVPPDNPSYTLKRVSMSKEEEKGYYYGYSNEILWPLSHMVFRRPSFNQEHWEMYKKINMRFAKAIVEEIGDRKAFVWIQDYHLCLLPKYLKQLAPKNLMVAHFWHIPWSTYEAFRICPQKKEILEGLLANDLLGFHITYHCNNFFDSVERELECKIDLERQTIVRNDHETVIRPFPISVDFEGINEFGSSQEVKQEKEILLDKYRLKDLKILLGVDRIDYTKGIPEKLLALDMLLDNHPELKGKIVFFQVGVETRLHLSEYKTLNSEVNALVEQINWKHSTGTWKPIIFERQQFSFKQLCAIYQLSDVAVVGSLHDGMNMVAKEYIASRSDKRGVLVLSQFTGAARELTDAILVNPYDRGMFSEGLFKALSMSDKAMAKRMKKMRELLEEANIYDWTGNIITELLAMEFNE